MTHADRSFLAEVVSVLTRAGFKAQIPNGRSKRPGFSARCFARETVFVFDNYGSVDRATFALVCEALAGAGYALTDCSPTRGSEYVRLGTVRVMRK